MNIIGCGTGRCGTKSLVELINGCKDWLCTHEMKPLLPWDFDRELMEDRVKYFQGHNQIGDVAYYYLPYLEEILNETDNVKVICLKRDQEETVESFLRKVPYRNHWADHDGRVWHKDRLWDSTFPNMGLSEHFSGEELKRLSLQEYWSYYYSFAEYIEDRFPDKMKIYNIDVLNDRGLQESMFDFIGIDNPNLQVGLKRNASK